MVINQRLQLLETGFLTSTSPMACAKLVSWCAHPEPNPEVFEGILNGLSNGDLMLLMSSDNIYPARIAWGEYGRRRKLADIKVVFSHTADTVFIEYKGQGMALHGVALYVDEG